MVANSVNWGSLREIPGISINRFGSLTGDTNNQVNRTINRAFFLTHHDLQTVKDVLNHDFIHRLVTSEVDTVRLYMQRLSFDFIVGWASSSDDKEFHVAAKILKELTSIGRIVFLRKESPIRLNFMRNLRHESMESVLVFTISAGHNPGSIMLLFETSNQRVLFTGNCRLSLSDLKYCEPLHLPHGEVKIVSSIYVDTTFCVENVMELPSRKTIISEMFKEIKTNISTYPEARYEFWSTGRLAHQENLHFIQAVYYGFRDKIQVELSSVDEASTERDLELDHCLLRFYAELDQEKHSELIDNFESENDYQLPEATEIRLGCNMTDGSEDDIQLNELELSIYSEADNRIRGIFSNHLSRFELARLINYLQIDLNNVHPLYLPNGLNIAQMGSLIASSCNAVFGQEPKDILEEHPSNVYDCTGGLTFPVAGKSPNPKLLSISTCQEFIHRV